MAQTERCNYSKQTKLGIAGSLVVVLAVVIVLAVVLTTNSSTEGDESKNTECKIEEGVMIYIANNVKTFFSSGQVECENSCASTDLCVAWTLRTSDHLCWLKSDDSMKGKKAGYITGTKACGGKSVSKWEQIKSDDCWPKCSKKLGLCPDFCGSKGYCCRKGFDGCPPGAGEASPDMYSCVTEIGYLGCFKDTDSTLYPNKLYSNFVKLPRNNSVANCRAACKNKFPGSNFLGLEKGSYCYCGEEPNPPTKAHPTVSNEKCHELKCPEEIIKSTCGGIGYIKVYKVNP